MSKPTVRLQTNHGAITIELDEQKAPKTVANFLTYAREGFYDDTLFHRVINNFMIQGGGFSPGMKQKSTHAPIENEAKNGLRNERGTIAMARTSDPHSATAQFFINVVDNDFLNHSAPTEVVQKKLLQPGGLQCSEFNTGQQWDAPNGWAPLQWMAVTGLARSGQIGLAKEIANRWLQLNEKVYKETGKLMEKYNVADLSKPAGGGEYKAQDGFGWTNGVYLAMKEWLKE